MAITVPSGTTFTRNNRTRTWLILVTVLILLVVIAWVALSAITREVRRGRWQHSDAQQWWNKQRATETIAPPAPPATTHATAPISLVMRTSDLNPPA